MLRGRGAGGSKPEGSGRAEVSAEQQRQRLAAKAAKRLRIQEAVEKVEQARAAKRQRQDAAEDE